VLGVIVCHVLQGTRRDSTHAGAPTSGRSRFRNPENNNLGPSAIRSGESLRQFPGEKMAGQAGWYRAPGEEGILRYWNGTAWTDHRQPAPAAVAAAPPVSPEPLPTLVEYPDPMAEFERQFDTPSFASFEPAPAPSPRSAETSASFPRSFVPRPTPTERSSLGPIALGPIVADVIAPRSVVGHAPNRAAVLSAARGMGIAILVLVIGLGAMAFFSAQTLAGAGEGSTTGIVTSLGSTAGNSCTPIARFAVRGKSFTANSSAAVTPCSVGLGQDVNIVYSAADPAGAARIQLGGSLAQYLWLVPLLAFLTFLACLTMFLVRAGSIGGGMALIRDGGSQTRKAAAGR
jgi:hypothetical protein